MAENKDRMTPREAEDARAAEIAQRETQAESSPRTTIPDFMAVATDATTDRGSRPGTLGYAPFAEVSSGPAASHSSFSGLLGRFHYVRTLGEGAFGVVVQVWDPELQTHRAIKVPHQHLIESGRINPESYIREARKLAHLGKHPGIVSVTDVQRMENGMPYVVSEFVPGGSLSEKIQDKRMTWQEAAKLVIAIADAVAHAHTKGIVHRDLKPANILLSEDGKPVVADFGLALGDEEFSYRSSVCGTYQYMSPQQLQGQADRVDGRADVYSLGVILYQLVAGRVPYKARDVASLKREIINDEPTPLRQYNPEAPLELQEICQRAMAKSLDNRYATAADFATALRKLLKSPAAGGAQALATGSRSNRWVPAGAMVAGCALVGWGLFAILPDRGPVPLPIQTPPPALEIHFQKVDQNTFDRSLRDSDLPLEIGDKLQFHVGKLPQPMFAYIYWIDADGEPKRVWPSPNTPLDQQSPVEQLSSPPGAESDAVDQPWWEVSSASGPPVFFVGLSEKGLDATQLGEFEAESKSMRDSLLTAMRRGDNKIAEFEYPAQAKTYELRNNELYRTRGGDLHLVISPKTYATDHSQLQKWFSAYHGWIVDAKQ